MDIEMELAKIQFPENISVLRNKLRNYIRPEFVMQHPKLRNQFFIFSNFNFEAVRTGILSIEIT